MAIRIRMVDRVAARVLNSQHPLWRKLDRVGAKLWGNAADALDARTLAALGAGGPKVTFADITHLMAASSSSASPPGTGGTQVARGGDTQLFTPPKRTSDETNPAYLFDKANNIKPSPRIKFVYAAAGAVTAATLLTAAPAVLIVGLPALALAVAVHLGYQAVQNIRVSRTWAQLSRVAAEDVGKMQGLAVQIKDRRDLTAIFVKLNHQELKSNLTEAIAWLNIPGSARNDITGDPLFKTYADASAIQADLTKLQLSKTDTNVAGRDIFEATVQARIDKLSALTGAQQTSMISTVALLFNPASYETDLDSIIRGDVVSLNLTNDQLGTLLGRARQIANGVPALSAKSRSARDILYTLLNDEGGSGNV